MVKVFDGDGGGRLLATVRSETFLSSDGFPLASSASLAHQQGVENELNDVAEERDRERGENVNHRMLTEKNGRDADKNR